MWIQDNSLPVQNILGEGPLWHPKEHCLYWVDIHAGTINHFNPARGIDKTFDICYPVGCLAFCTNGDLILAVGQSLPSRLRKSPIQNPIEKMRASMMAVSIPRVAFGLGL